MRGSSGVPANEPARSWLRGPGRGVVAVIGLPWRSLEATGSGAGPADRRGRRGVARGMRPLHRPDPTARRSGRVVRQEEVLAEWEALVVGRQVDPPEVAIALERDAEHVVGLAFHPLRALPH